MGRAHECRFELRWRQVNAILAHGAEESPEGFRVRRGGGSPVSDGTSREKPGKHRADPVMAHGYAGIFGCGRDSGDHFCRKLVELGVNIFVLPDSLAWSSPRPSPEDFPRAFRLDTRGREAQPDP